MNLQGSCERPSMKRRFLAIHLVLLASLCSTVLAQTLVPTPAGWKEEVITLPPDFAPKMSWQGQEILKFSPGMFKAEAEDFFSYVFLLQLSQGEPDWEKQLLSYYSGLAKAVFKDPKYDTSTFKVTITGNSYPKTAVLDWTEPFVSKKPQRLYLKLSRLGSSDWFVSASPQPAQHQIWNRMQFVENLTRKNIHGSRGHKLFETLSGLDGQSFSGKMTFPNKADHPMNKAMKIHIHKTESGQLRIPLQVGEDRSRTWVLTETPSGIQLKHEHRHSDGTLDKVTNYGGLAPWLGLGSQLVFPADRETATLLPEAATNVWTLRLSPDGKTLSYYLERHSKPRFEAQFVLD